MNSRSSRRNFLATGLGFSASGLAVTAPPRMAAGPKAKDAVPQIEYRTLGKTGLKVSSLGFGCMLASDPLVIERAIDLGINYIDTARSYQGGNNERMVGTAIKGKRDKIVLSSKSRTFTKKDALAELDTSLRELGTDHLDVWFLHVKNEPQDATDGLLEAQEVARKAGKIRFRGISFHFNMEKMLPFVANHGSFDIALASYNFTLGPEVGQAIVEARKLGLGVVAMKVMAGGYARIQRGDRLYGQDAGKLTGRLKQPGAMLAALKWALQNKSVDTAIIGITDFEELDEDMRAMSEPFTGRDETLLARQLETIRPYYCRACGACSGVCDKGVRVADNLRFLMYAEGYGQFSMARQAFLDQPAETRPSPCKDCAECSVNCPNGVAVKANLIRARVLFS